MSPTAQRSWGFWTEAKLGILRSYLPALLQASKGKATEFVYLDAFAGDGHGTSRLTGEAFSGSARIALDTKVAGADILTREAAEKLAGPLLLGR